MSVNLNQPDQDPEVWREVLGLLDEADGEGARIVAQVAGRSIGILYCLHGSVHPLLFHPAYAEIADLPMPERLAALADPERRRRLVDDVPDDGGFFQRVGARQGRSDVARRRARHRLRARRRSTSIAAVARRQGVPPMEVLLDQLTSDDGNGMVYAPFFNYSYGDLSMTYEATLHPRTRMGLSATPARTAARSATAARPRSCSRTGHATDAAGPRLPLEHVVHRQTQQTAALYGLRDRGLVAPGHARRPERHRLRRAVVRRCRAWRSTCPPAAAGSCSGRRATRADLRRPVCRRSTTTSSPASCPAG